MTVSAVENEQDQRFESFVNQLVVDTSELHAEKQQALLTRAEKAIEKLCIVGRTLNHGAAARTEATAQQP